MRALAQLLRFAARWLAGSRGGAQVGARADLFTTPDLVDDTPTAGSRRHGERPWYNCLFNGIGFDAAVSRAPSDRAVVEVETPTDLHGVARRTARAPADHRTRPEPPSEVLAGRASDPVLQAFPWSRRGYVMNSDGSGQRRLTSDGGDDAVFSPDGRRIGTKVPPASPSGSWSPTPAAAPRSAGRRFVAPPARWAVPHQPDRPQQPA